LLINASKASFPAKPTWVISRTPLRAKATALIVEIVQALLQFSHLD
jgi:hypothetical protein